MSTKVFLSLAHVDRDFVAQIRARLPAGLAYFYEDSFENGEQLLSAMERAVSDSAVFVLFASKEGLASAWVGFELAQARIQSITNPNHRILIFPTDPDVQIRNLPTWLQSYWIPKAGFTPPDVARYITHVLLDPNVGISAGSVSVIGRGITIDRMQQIVAEHITHTGAGPNVYILPGFRGIGRRTFAQYYMRNALSASVNLPYGPILMLPAQADLADIHRALRVEISPVVSAEALLLETTAFQRLGLQEQVNEVIRLLRHFGVLGQAITFVSASGFFEDRGEPKSWVLSFLRAIPPEILVFIVTNRHFRPEILSAISNVVQMRVGELDDKDTRALMVLMADRLRLKDFKVSEQLIRAIGGHADVAKAAVRLASIKGVPILERDPRQIFNIQNTILGENLQDGSLTPVQKDILCLLSWVPSLNADLMERVLLASGAEVSAIIEALEELIMSCLVTPSGSNYAISNSIRFLFRRFNITPPELLQKFSKELSGQWSQAQKRGEFRADLFETFVFMHALEGAALPRELRPLLTPGMLHEVVRETYAFGKGEADAEALERVIHWGKLAEDINMSEATREEILSNVARAHIRLGQFSQAVSMIDSMAARGYRSVPFLRGHMYRRQERYPQAIEMLVTAVKDRKVNRSAVHELALAYKKSGRLNDLRTLLQNHQDLIRDSAMFADFQIGVDLARGKWEEAEAGIRNLRRNPDDEGRSDVRMAQLYMRKGGYSQALGLLNHLASSAQGDKLRIRSMRAMAAAHVGDIDTARKDIDFVKKFPAWQAAGTRLEANLLVEQRRPGEARELLDALASKSAEDWLLYARALEIQSELPETTLDERQAMHTEATEIRLRHNFSLEYDFGE